MSVMLPGKSYTHREIYVHKRSDKFAYRDDLCKIYDGYVDTLALPNATNTNFQFAKCFICFRPFSYTIGFIFYTLKLYPNYNCVNCECLRCKVDHERNICV